MAIRIFEEVFLFVIGIILWKKGSKLSKTYDMTLPLWKRQPITDTELFGKSLQVISILSFTVALSLIARWVMEYFNLY